jgi:hypothetical protein
MKKILVCLIILIGCNLYAVYNPTFPAKTLGKDTLQLTLQSVFKSTYGFAETQQEHFFGFAQYGIIENVDFGISTSYHIIDIKTPMSKEKKHGVGDASLYGRWSIYGNNWIDLGLKCDLNVPLGNKDFSSPTFTHNSILIFESNLIYIRPYVIFGHYTTDKDDGYFRFNFGVQRMIVPAWIIFIDVYTEVSQKGNDPKIPCWVVIGNVVKFGDSIFKIEYIVNTKDYDKERGMFALRYMHNFK